MSKDKLTAKQTIHGDTDLSAFIKGAETPYVSHEPKRSVNLTKINITNIGRPAEVKGEPRKAVINVKFTEKEKKVLEKQAQGVPLSSYVRSKLKDHGII